MDKGGPQIQGWCEDGEGKLICMCLSQVDPSPAQVAEALYPPGHRHVLFEHCFKEERFTALIQNNGIYWIDDKVSNGGVFGGL